MLLAHLCADEGLFDAIGTRIGRLARGSARATLYLGVAAAALVTVTLSLDATVVLLTPVLLVASSGRPAAYATVRLANSASLLLPVSNLTNLLAFSATGLSFVAFTGRMLPVWLVVVAAELVVLRWWCRHDLQAPATPTDRVVPIPLTAGVVVAGVLVALAAEVTPWIAATLGAGVLAVRAVRRRRTTIGGLLREANLPFAMLVLAWSWAVLLLRDTVVGDTLGRLVPDGSSWWALTGTALLAMGLSAAVNNLPATLLLLPAAATCGTDTVLALLIGVDVGANLAMSSSLANLLWWRSGAHRVTTLTDVHRLGLTTTPLLVVLAVTVLWLAR